MALKRFVWVIFLSMITTIACTQDNYFVYLQTENNQPFYARMNNKVLSSTLTGYLILPKMQAGTHSIRIGFPKDASGEKKFTIEIQANSEGFLLKNFEDKGWQLFNLQSMALLSPDGGSETSIVSNTTLKEDAFSRLLASATKDSTLLTKTIRTEPATIAPVPNKPAEVIVQKEEIVQSKQESAFKEEKAISAEGNTEEAKVEKELITKKETTPRSEVNDMQAEVSINTPKRILNVSGRDGNEMIYIDGSKAKADTIRVFIPSETPARSVIEYTDANVHEARTREEAMEYTITPTIIKEDPKPLPGKIEEKKAEAQKEMDKPVIEKKAESQVFIIHDETPAKNPNRPQDELIVLPPASTKSNNSDCKDLATNNDFLKMRKRMAAGKDPDAMVFAAKKVFKTKCFSTEQIRNLSYLFLTDEGRYMFFDAAYPYTSDSEKFPGLISQLKDEYYINRFQALIQK